MKISLGEEAIIDSLEPYKSFLSMMPDDADALHGVRQQLLDRHFPRDSISQILYEYNESLGNDVPALLNAKRLKDSDSCCVITGQQLGFMTGPIYTVLKAISCLLAARETGAIPIFWAATEDHDIHEIDHAYQLDPYGNMVRYSLNWPDTGVAVEDLPLLPAHLEVMRAFWQTAMPLKPLPSLSLSSATSYSEVMMRLLVHLFAGTGMVFLEPRLLRSLAVPFLSREIQQSAKLTEILRNTTRRVSEAGGTPVLHISQGPQLFYKDASGRRRRLHYDNERFHIGSRVVTEDELLHEVEEYPERFSTAAAARPVLQSLLLPTLAYVAGPSEIAYHSQLKEYYLAHESQMPGIIPRISATFITPEARNFLNVLKLKPWDPLPNNWDELLPQDAELGKQFEKACEEDIAEIFGEDLVPSVHHALRHFTDHVREKAIQHKLNRLGLPHHALHFLRNLLYPQDSRQERVLNWWAIQKSAHPNLVHELLSTLNYRERRHHFIDVT